MDWAGLATAIGAIGAVIPILVQAFKEIRKLRVSYEKVWTGIVRRGYVEAVAHHHLEKIDGKWKVSDRAREVFAPITPALKEMRQRLRDTLGVDPSDDELAWGIEMEYQDFLTDKACVAVGVNQHGCLALAVVLAREP